MTPGHVMDDWHTNRCYWANLPTVTATQSDWSSLKCLSDMRWQMQLLFLCIAHIWCYFLTCVRSDGLACFHRWPSIDHTEWQVPHTELRARPQASLPSTSITLTGHTSPIAFKTLSDSISVISQRMGRATQPVKVPDAFLFEPWCWVLFVCQTSKMSFIS